MVYARLSVERVRILIARRDKSKLREDKSLCWTAAAGGHEEILSMLIEAGADFTAKPPDHETTPDEIAMKNGHGGVMDILFRANT